MKLNVSVSAAQASSNSDKIEALKAKLEANAQERIKIKRMLEDLQAGARKPKAEAPVESLSKQITTVNALLPEGFRFRKETGKSGRLSADPSAMYLVGSSDKVRKLSITVTGNRFSASRCLKGFLGSAYEMWPDDAYTDKPLTAANLEKLLKKYKFI